jgi:TonB-dependent SusC/RagA subfamily outer membrane receptor
MKRIQFLLVRISYVLMILTTLSSSGVDEDPRYQRISAALQRFTIQYPQQKVFLHLDKASYKAGEILWIKAYLLNDLDYFPDTLSTNLYVELISPFQTRVEIRRFQMFHGFGRGDFHLSDTLPEGLYEIRAYTNWMRNFDEGFFFRQNFLVKNTGYLKIISPKQARMNSKDLNQLEKNTGEIDLQFMPEGGYLVNGLESVVAFKAVNRQGKGVDIEGQITDDLNHETGQFKSFCKGMGTFILKPVEGRKYMVWIRKGEKEVAFRLPQALDHGLVMHAEILKDDILLKLNSNNPPTDDPVSHEFIITGQTGGVIYYHTLARLENNEAEISISKKNFPSGIVQLTVFSGRGVPLCERLAFILRSSLLKIHLAAYDSSTAEGKKMVLYINTTDSHNRPLRANLSMAVTREVNAQPQYNRDNILSNLLLTSDLKGYVEDPLDYFTLRTTDMDKALDNLLLTQGWRRFDWGQILAGNYPDIRYHEEKGISVTGKITRNFFGIPLKNCKVQLSVMDAYNDVFSQQSAKNGNFLFDNMVYYDTVSMKLEAWRTSGTRNLVIMLGDLDVSNAQGMHGSYTSMTTSERDNKAYHKKQYLDYKKKAEAREQELKEERNTEITGIYHEPDQVIRSGSFSEGNRNVLEAIKGRIPGVQVNGDQVLIRGPNTILGSTQPLYLLDGVPVIDVSTIQSIPVEDIDRVEILKGPSSAIYGMRGANGVVAVYTKRGHYMKKGIIEFDMLGYSTPRKFYQPKYKAGEEPAENYTLIWEPQIITDGSGNARLEFDKPLKGDYRFCIQGISYQGHIGFAESVIYNE